MPTTWKGGLSRTRCWSLIVNEIVSNDSLLAFKIMNMTRDIKTYRNGMGMRIWLLAAFLISHFSFLISSAQTFFNLMFSHTVRLGADFADSTYTVTIEYPEFVPMTQADIEGYRRLAATASPLEALPTVSQMVGVERKQGVLHVSFIPLVLRDGKYQKLVSFKLNVKGHRLSKKLLKLQAQRRASGKGRYADNSVLSSGTWAKIPRTM